MDSCFYFRPCMFCLSALLLSVFLSKPSFFSRNTQYPPPLSSATPQTTAQQGNTPRSPCKSQDCQTRIKSDCLPPSAVMPLIQVNILPPIRSPDAVKLQPTKTRHDEPVDTYPRKTWFRKYPPSHISFPPKPHYPPPCIIPLKQVNTQSNPPSKYPPPTSPMQPPRQLQL
ncbi:hypothetical protein F5144DRAFT_575722, partial [Chaetomium tenue]